MQKDFSALITSVDDEDAYTPASAEHFSEQDIERWNNEWLAYLGREWRMQLLPHNELPLTPPLPDTALEMLRVSTGPGYQLALYCDKEWIDGMRVMELGCGCGNLGKQLGRYAKSYLGVDFSTLALQVGRLVSPANCTYVHAGDAAGLARFHGQIDTVVGRYFWIHQNFEMARRNLDLMESMLRPGGRIYADFFWPAPGAEHFVVLSPRDPMSRTYPSAMFRYEDEDVQALIAGRPLRIVREEIDPATERRYVVFERT